MSGNIDGLLCQVLAMGFDPEDCQQAIQMGKLTADEVIEWIVNGKPGSSQVLRLSNASSGPVSESTIGANPFVPGACGSPPAPPTTMDWTSSTGQSSSRETTTHGGDIDTKEEHVKSRLLVNEKQRQIRQQFEDKQRALAEKKAREERMAQRKAKEAILKHIQEDREGQRRMATPSEESPVKTSAAASPPPTQSPPTANPDTTNIQIRLPSGRTMTNKFSIHDKLEEVLKFARKDMVDHPSTHQTHLVQPFPRVEFTAEHLGRTLSDLKLVPSASLVLMQGQKPATEQSPPVVVRASQARPTAQSPQQPPPPDTSATDSAKSGEPTGANSDESSDLPDHPALGLGEIEPELQIGGPPVLPPPSPNQLAMLNHQWGGGGHSLSSVGSNPEMMPHHRRDPRQEAVQAARRRFERAANQNTTRDDDVEVIGARLLPVPQLFTLAMRRVHGCIGDPRHHIRVGSIPVIIATHIINEMMKENLLTPKLLHAFIPCHLSTLRLDNYGRCTNELVDVLGRHVYLTELSLQACTLFTEDRLTTTLANLTRLQKLNLYGCRQVTNNIAPALIRLQSLEQVCLAGTGIKNQGVVLLAESKPPHLYSLNLKGTAITKDVLSALGKIPNLAILDLEATKLQELSGVESIRALSTLNIRQTPMQEEALLVLAGLAPTLTALDISETIKMKGDRALHYIKGLTNLRCLHLPDRPNLTDEGLKHIQDMPLTSIDLCSFARIDDEAISCLSRITSLTKLLLGSTKITDGAMVYIQGLTNIQELVLDRTLISNEGLFALKDFTQLKTLSLAEVIGISDKCVEHLQKLNSLRKLNLFKTRISNTGICSFLHINLAVLNIDLTFVTPPVAMTLVGSSNLPALERVIYRRSQEPPQAMEEG